MQLLCVSECIDTNHMLFMFLSWMQLLVICAVLFVNQFGKFVVIIIGHVVKYHYCKVSHSILCIIKPPHVIGMAMIFPFLPFMIHDFFPYLAKTELGHKAGYLGSAYFIGNFIGSLLWGWVSDRVGRRPVLLVGMCGTIASEILFGLSQNFTWAVIGRLMWGLLNGNIGVAKTYISEVCMYEENELIVVYDAIGRAVRLNETSVYVLSEICENDLFKFAGL